MHKSNDSLVGHLSCQIAAFSVKLDLSGALRV